MSEALDRQARLVVSCGEGSKARAAFFVDGELLREGDAFIGRNGVGKEREGDGKTPLGEFGVRSAFGILPNPGTQFGYISVGPGTVACDSPGPYYNRIVDADVEGERMSELSPEYDYGLELDFNHDNIYPLGSAIFVHCKGAKESTGGCVALDRDFVHEILVRAPRTLRVTIKQ